MQPRGPREIDTRTSVLVQLHAYENVKPMTAMSLARDTPFIVAGYRTELAWIGHDALLPRSRSLAATQFLDDKRFDVAVWLDADMQWQGFRPGYPGDIPRLIESCKRTKGIVGGVYSKRGFGLGTALRFLPSVKRDSFETGTDELIEADYVATGFMAIHREAIEKIAAGMGRMRGQEGMSDWVPVCTCFDVIGPDGKIDHLSEDWALCARARRAGVPIHVDAMPVLIHHGSHGYSVNDAFLGMPERKQAVNE